MDDRRWIPYLARVLALAGLHFAGAKLGQAFTLTGVSLVWAPAGIALAALLVHGYGLRPGIGLRVILANLGLSLPGWTLRLTRRPPALCSAVESFARGLVQRLRLRSHTQW
ncbi:MAG: hypothetical protein ACHBNF_09170 [Chromatiales bacterium]